MLTRRSLLAGFAGMGAAMLAPLEAVAASWVNLGSRNVSLILDHDTIHVGTGVGLFRRIRLKVSGSSPIFIHSMKVVFGNGNSHSVDLKFLFLPGSNSRNIDLPGQLRFIRRVELLYTKVPLGGSATVTLQGYKV
ncbi:MAG: hypothetical protein ABL879_10970 [Devosia sp.]